MRASIRFCAHGSSFDFVFTHDSIGVRRWQASAIEQLASCAPAQSDCASSWRRKRVVEAWKIIASYITTGCIGADAQAMPTFDRTNTRGLEHARGRHSSDAPGGKPEVILMGTAAKFRSALRLRETQGGWHSSSM